MKIQFSRPESTFRWVISLCLCVTFTLSSVNPALAIPQGAFTKKVDTRPSDERSSPTDIDDINIPEDIGLIKESFKGKGDKLIVHIQDAHCNFEAQTNIAKIIELLMDQKGLALVALEGSAGEIDTSLFTTFPDEEIRKEVATYFMKKGKICGAEHLAINTKKPILLYGIEKKEYYLENLEAFTTTLSSRSAAKKVCGEIKAYLNKLKQYIYNDQLKALDRKIDDYDQDKIKFVDFCTYLNKKAAYKKIDLNRYENFSRLITTLELEKDIDFNKVEDERSAIISKLEKKLSQEELSRLLKKSLSYRQKKITGGEYYTYLKSLAAKAKIKLSDFKNFNSYVDYIDAYTRIDNPSLFRELKALQEDIKESLYTNDDQRKLNRLSKDIKLITDMVDISLSKDEAGYLLENSDKLNSAEFTNFIQRQASRYALAYSPNPNVSVIDEVLPTLEKFYQVANKREDALLENTLNKMDEKGYKISVLISGGFHTEGLTQRLKDRGISYLVVAPRITDLEAETPYLEILSGGETKFDKLLSTEKKKLAPSPLSSPPGGEGENELPPTSLNAKNPSFNPDGKGASPAAVAAFDREAVLLLLSGHIYRLRQENPFITEEELRRRLDEAKANWLRDCEDPIVARAVNDIQFDLRGLAMDARGCFYIPVTVASVRDGEVVREERTIRYYNRALAPREEEEGFKPEHQGIAETVGIQILTEGQLQLAMQVAPRPQAEMPAVEGAPPAAEVQTFTRLYLDWARTEGRHAALPQRIERLAEIFVNSMHGLRGSPDAWLMGMVEALNPGNETLLETAREDRQRYRRRLAQACGPRALFDALHNPEQAPPIFTERDSLPSAVSLDLSALLLTAVDMSHLGGRVAHIDDDERLYHTALSLCQVGGMIALRADNTATNIELLEHLTQGSQRCIVHVRRDIGDEAPNHFVEVETVTDQEVTFIENGERQTEDIETFRQRLDRDIFVLVRSQVHDELMSLQERLEQTRNIKFDILDLDDNRLKSTIGACGVMTTVGGRFGFAEELGSMRLMEYRGFDDEGFTYMNEFGVQVVKVAGYSEGLARVLYTHGQGPTERAMIYLYGYDPHEDLIRCDDDDLKKALIKLRDGRELNDEENATLHKKWRSLSQQERQALDVNVNKARDALRNRQNIGAQESTYATFVAGDMYGPELDGAGHVNKEKAVNLGKLGWDTGSGIGSQTGLHKRLYQIQDNIPQVVGSLKENHALDIEYIKYFIKFELEGGMAEHPDILEQINLEVHAQDTEAPNVTQEDLMRFYERLVDRVIRGEKLEPADQIQWDWVMRFLNGRTIRLPSQFANDPVRKMFRLQAALIGNFRIHDGWQDGVEAIYVRNAQAAGIENVSAEQWLEEWRKEASLNIAGRASQALTQWFQERYLRSTNPEETCEQIIGRFGIEKGTLDSITLGNMNWLDYVGGHDRWATTGSTDKKDGQPHTDSGALAGLSLETIQQHVMPHAPALVDESGDAIDSQVRFAQLIKVGQDYVPEHLRGMPTRVSAHNGDLNSNTTAMMRKKLATLGYKFTNEENKVVLTDTKTLMETWEYVRDAVYFDQHEGRVSQAHEYTHTEETDPGHQKNFLNGIVKTPEGQEVTYAALWNRLLDIATRRGEEITLDLLALRVALCIFREGSEIALDVKSAHAPDRHICVSHNRPLYIVIIDEIDPRTGKPTGHVKYQVTSDKSSALKLFDTRQVDRDVRKLQEAEQEARDKRDGAKKKRDDIVRQLDEMPPDQRPDDWAEQRQQAINDYNGKFVKINAELEAKREEIGAPYKARKLITLKGEQKVVSLSEVTNDEGRREVRYEFTDLLGNKIEPEESDGEIKIEENVTIPIDLADKGKFRTFAEKHIDEIDWIAAKSVANHVRPDGTVDMAMQKEMRKKADSEELEEVITKYGVDIDKLKEKYGEHLERLERIFITGIGSSERDALVVERLFRTMLPHVKIIPVGPGKLVSENQRYNRESDMIVGISWSGSTALTLFALEGAVEKGVGVAALTGKPSSDIGELTLVSLGTIHVRTGEERAVFTTKGFLGILFDLGLLGVQLSQLRDGALDAEERARVQEQRKEIVEGQLIMPENLEGIAGDERLNLDEQKSWVNAEGERYKNGRCALVIGSERNSPIIREGELKEEETRWILGKAFDYDDDIVYNLLYSLAKQNRREPIIIQATDEARLEKAVRLIELCAELNLNCIVQTFDSFQDESYTGELSEYWQRIRDAQQNAGKADDKPNAYYEAGEDGRDRIQVFTVPKVNPALQGIADAIFYFKFAVALARAGGLSDLEIASSRNLAKSVTVKGIEVPGELYEWYQFVAELEEVDVEQVVSDHIVEIQEYWKEYEQAMHQAGDDEDKKNIVRVDKAIARLPLAYDEAVRRALPKQRGGEMGRYSEFHPPDDFDIHKIKKVVVVTEERADAGVAAEMAQGPFGYIERSMTGKDLFKRPKDPSGAFEDTKTVGGVPIYGYRYSVTYDFERHLVTITREPGQKGEGGWIDFRCDVTVNDRGEPTEVGIPDEVLPKLKDKTKGLFGREFTITAGKINGLVFDADQPALAGIELIVHNIDDYDLMDDIDPEDTLVVPIRRSNHRPLGRDAGVPDIEDARTGRTSEQAAVAGDALSEGNMMDFLSKLPEGTSVFSITDDHNNSDGVRQKGKDSFGNIALAHRDLDAISTTGMYYMALMSLGIYIGYEKGADMGQYERALALSTHLSAALTGQAGAQQRANLADFLQGLRQNVFNQQYETVQIVGGAQDYASARAWETTITRFAPGTAVEALHVDESVHGPLAAVCYFIKKFLNQIFKRGVNPEFNPHPKEAPDSKHQDTLVVILGTDSRTLNAANIDANRNGTRNARLVVVVKEKDRNNADVLELENKHNAHIVTIPDAPNELTSFSHMALAAIFANELNRSKDERYAYGKVESGYALARDVVEETTDITPEQKANLEFVLRLTDKGDYYETKQGGRIYKDVDLRNIDHTAIIGKGCWVRGPLTKLGKGVVIRNQSLVINAEVGDNAIIEESKLDGRAGAVIIHNSTKEKPTTIKRSVLRTVEEKDKWEYSEGSEYKVDSRQTIVGAGSTIDGQSTLVNATIGEEAVIHESAIMHSEIGSYNIVKHAKVNVTHTEDFVEIYGMPTEVDQAWIGFGMEIRNLAYIVGVHPNKAVALKMGDDRQIQPEIIKGIPQVAVVGNFGIYSDYMGELAVPEDGILTEINGGESSAHGVPLVGPAAVIAPDTRFIALDYVSDISGTEHLLRTQNTTLAMPYSIVGFDGTEAWGKILQGEARKGLSPRDTVLAWTFTYSPDTVINRTLAMAKKLEVIALKRGQDPKQAVRVLDDFPNKMLGTAIVMCELGLQSLQSQLKMATSVEQREKIEERMYLLTDAIDLYSVHLESHAWDFQDGRFANEWTEDAQGELSCMAPVEDHLEKFDLRALSEDEDYRQYKLAELLEAGRGGYQHPVEPITKSDVLSTLTNNPTPPDVIEQMRQDGRLAQDVFIGPGVNLGPNVRVRRGSALWRTYLDDTIVGENTRLANCMFEGSNIGDNAELTNFRGKGARIGMHVEGALGVAYETWVRDGTHIEPFARIKGRKGKGVGGVVGSPVTNVETDDGVVNHHLATEVYNTRAEAVRVNIDGRPVDFPNVTNFGGGSPVGRLGTGVKDVTVESAFIASNTVIEQGAFLGICAYVKNKVGENERVLPFTFTEGGGYEGHQLGRVLDLMPGVVFRHLISNTKKAMPVDQRHLADKLVVAVLRQMLAELKDMKYKLGNPTTAKEVPYYYDSVHNVEIQTLAEARAQLDEGIERFERHLGLNWGKNDPRYGKSPWEMKDHKFVHGYWKIEGDIHTPRKDWRFHYYEEEGISGPEGIIPPAAPAPRPTPSKPYDWAKREDWERGLERAQRARAELGEAGPLAGEVVARAQRTEQPQAFLEAVENLNTIARERSGLRVRVQRTKTTAGHVLSSAMYGRMTGQQKEEKVRVVIVTPKKEFYPGQVKQNQDLNLTRQLTERVLREVHGMRDVDVEIISDDDDAALSKYAVPEANTTPQNTVFVVDNRVHSKFNKTLSDKKINARLFGYNNELAGKGEPNLFIPLEALLHIGVAMLTLPEEQPAVEDARENLCFTYLVNQYNLIGVEPIALDDEGQVKDFIERVYNNSLMVGLPKEQAIEWNEIDQLNDHANLMLKQA